MNPKKITLSTGTEILLGKNAENNDELVKEYKDKSNIILHTAKPGSPFCIIKKPKPTKKEIQEAAIICAAKSQDWRDNKSDVKIHQFTGKQVKKPLLSKKGSWKIKTKPKIINAKKSNISQWLKKYNSEKKE